MMEVVEKEYKENKTPYLSWLGPKCILVVDHPDDIQAVLTSKACIEKSDIFRFFSDIHGKSLFAAPGEFFFSQNVSFYSNKIPTYFNFR